MKKWTFKKGILLLGIVYAVAIAVGLLLFYGYLARYEARHPVGAMNTYFSDLKKGDTAEILANSVFPFDAYNTADVYIQYLKETYKNGDGNWQYAQVDADDNPDTDSYAVYENGERYGTLHLTRDGDGWKVRADWAYTSDLQVQFTEELLVNGAPVTASCIRMPVKAFENAVKVPPALATHVVKTLCTPTLALSQGEAVQETMADGTVRVTRAPSDADAAALKVLAEQAARTYACFISGDAKLEDMQALVVAGTPFANGLRAYDQKWYNEHKSVEFENMQVADAVMWNDTAFSVQVRFDFTVSRGYDAHTYPTAYELAFVKQNGNFRLANLIPL